MPGAESPEESGACDWADASTLTQAMPVTVQTSTKPWPLSKWGTTACDTSGSNPAHTIAQAVSQAVNLRRAGRVNMGGQFISPDSGNG